MDAQDKIIQYLKNDKNVMHYHHFIHGVFIVCAFDKFNRDFLKWIDDNDLLNVSLQSVIENVYTIIVREEY